MMDIQSMEAQIFPVEMTLDQCIKCNICTTACPVAGVTDLFPGPKFAAPQAGRFRNIHQPTPDHSVDYCSGCRICNMVCPTGVKIAEMNARARASMVSQGKVSPVKRLRNNLIARSELIGKIGQPIAPISNAALKFRPIRWVVEKSLGIAQAAPLPAFSRERFTTWFKQRPKNHSATRKVVFFHGCSTNYYEPRVGKAAVQVLEKNGFEVIVPPQNCCGLPLLSNGEFAAARRYHQSNVSNLVEFARQGIPIVGTSTSCTLTLKEEAPELLDMHDQDSVLVAGNTYDFNEFLLMLLSEDSLNLDFRPMPFTLPYHAPCQYRAHRLGKPALEILNLIPELRIIDSQASCCGIAGTYGYKVEKYPIAMQVGEGLFDFIDKQVKEFPAQPPLAVCDSETCRWQITHGTGVPAVHPVEILAAAYGFPVDGPLKKFLS